MAEALHDNTSPPVLATVKCVVWGNRHVVSVIGIVGETTSVGGMGVAVGDGVGDPRGAGDAVLPGRGVCVGECGAVDVPLVEAAAPPLEELDEALALPPDNVNGPRSIEMVPRWARA